MRCVLLIVCCLLFIKAPAQIKWSDFDHITHYDSSDGLTGDLVYDIQEDHLGFMWLATTNGVSRFNGRQFENFTFYVENEEKLALESVYDILIDDHNNFIWVVGKNGVFYSSIRHISFIKYNLPFVAISSKYPHISSIINTKDNHLWIGGKAGIFYLSLNDLKVKQSIFEIDGLSLIGVNNVMLDPEDNQILWITNLEGLVKYNIETNKAIPYYFNQTKGLQENNINVLAIIKDKVVLGTYEAGVVVFDKVKQTFSKPLEEHFSSINKSVQHLFIVGNTVWITTQNELIQYNPISNLVINSQRHDFSSGKIRGVSYIDSRGLLWYNSKNGIFKYQPGGKVFDFIELKSSLMFDNEFLVEQIIEQDDYYYVIGYGGEGIYRFHPETHDVDIIKLNVLGAEKEHYVLRDMQPFKKNKFLILASPELVIFDPEHNTSQLAPIQIKDPSPSAQTLIKGRDNTYWIGSRKEGIYQIDFDTQTTVNIKEDLLSEGQLLPWVNEILLDTNDNVWVAKGSYTLIDRNGKVNHLPRNEVRYYNDVYSMVEDSQGRVWMAGNTEGLGYTNFDTFNKGINHIRDGYFVGVYKKNDSILWTVGSELGMLNTKTMQHTTVPISGTFKTPRIRGPVVKASNGDYVIGCNNGILVYNPEAENASTEVPQLYVKSIHANNSKIYYGADLERYTFKLPSGTKNMRLELGSLAFSGFDKLAYKYKIDDLWTEMGSNMEVNISNVSQGDYKLEVLATNQTGETLGMRSFNFVVQPYWYTTNLAIILYVLLALSTVYGLYRFNLKRQLAIKEVEKRKELDRFKSKMYANISHEFRTPLTIVKGLAGQLLKQQQDPDQKKLLNGIDRSNEQLLNLVNQMLDLSSLDARKMEVHYKHANIISFLEQCVDLYRSYTNSKGLRVAFISNRDELYMDFDDDKLQKVINNLISNAIKFTPQGGQIRVKVRAKDNELIIKVQDTGRGIEKTHFKKVFDRHFKTHDLSGGKGSGIGLALTKELVHLMDGHISVRSKKGKGSVFTVKLPIRKEAAHANIDYQMPFVKNVTESSQLTSTATTNLKKPIILVVEDNQDIQNYFTMLLGYDYNLITADNGIEALKIASKEKIDFILSDVMMPIMNGFEFCRQIKANINTSHIPFVMISARTDSMDKQKAYSLGVDAYLTKPFNSQELEIIIKKLLEKQEERSNFLKKLLHLKQDFKESPSINQLDLDLIKNLQLLVLDNTNKLTIDQLAKKLVISRAQLHRKISALTGMSTSQYINYVRLEKAKYLLTTTTLTVKEIAFAVGFQSPTYFSKVFKKELSTTPESYRLEDK